MFDSSCGRELDAAIGGNTVVEATYVSAAVVAPIAALLENASRWCSWSTMIVIDGLLDNIGCIGFCHGSSFIFSCSYGSINRSCFKGLMEAVGTPA